MYRIIVDGGFFFIYLKFKTGLGFKNIEIIFIFLIYKMDLTRINAEGDD